VPAEKVQVNKQKLSELLELIAYPKDQRDIQRAQKRAVTMQKQLKLT
jgi:hypothetical protein